jgi:hypothetical protein
MALTDVLGFSGNLFFDGRTVTALPCPTSPDIGRIIHNLRLEKIPEACFIAGSVTGLTSPLPYETPSVLLVYSFYKP